VVFHAFPFPYEGLDCPICYSAFSPTYKYLDMALMPSPTKGLHFATRWLFKLEKPHCEIKPEVYVCCCRTAKNLHQIATAYGRLVVLFLLH